MQQNDYMLCEQSCHVMCHTPISMIVHGARTCYQSHNKSNTLTDLALLRHCIKNKHTSVLEHCNIVVNITTSRAIMDELLRHRHLSASVESTRYCSYGNKKIRFITCIDVSKNNNERYMHHAYEASVFAYKQLLLDGVAPQHARDVLPLSIACDAVLTANVTHWRHIFSRRLDRAAHPMMRALMWQLLNRFMEYPDLAALFEDIYDEYKQHYR